MANMSSNDTSNKTINDEFSVILVQTCQRTFFIESIINYIIFVPTLLTFIFGVASWCVIRKFRSYKNFVFLNTIFANVLLDTVYTIYINNNRYLSQKNGTTQWLTFNLMLYYLLTVRNHWLVVICHMLYVDIVKVFNGHITRRFLKSAVFGWVLALISPAISFCEYLYMFDTGNILRIMCLTIPLVTNCVFYLIIVFSIFRSFNSNANSAKDNWRRLYLATIIFISSDTLLVTTFVIKLIWRTFRNLNGCIAILLQIILSGLNITVLNIFFVAVKSNREIWREYYVKRLNDRSLSVRPKNNDINVQEATVCEPADG